MIGYNQFLPDAKKYDGLDRAIENAQRYGWTIVPEDFLQVQKGTIIRGPDDSGYIIKNNIIGPQRLTVSDFKGFGGAPVPKPGEQMPGWLYTWLSDKSLV